MVRRVPRVGDVVPAGVPLYNAPPGYGRDPRFAQAGFAYYGAPREPLYYRRYPEPYFQR